MAYWKQDSYIMIIIKLDNSPSSRVVVLARYKSVKRGHVIGRTASTNNMAAFYIKMAINEKLLSFRALLQYSRLYIAVPTDCLH